MPRQFLYLALVLFLTLGVMLPVGVIGWSWEGAKTAAPEITGNWEATFTLTGWSSNQPVRPEPVSGWIVLDLDTGRRSELVNTHYFGSSSVDFREFGLTQPAGTRGVGWPVLGPGEHDQERDVIGLLRWRDSVTFIIYPYPSHGPIVLKGRRERDRIAGTWEPNSGGWSARGTFVMRNARPPVAARARRLSRPNEPIAFSALRPGELLSVDHVLQGCFHYDSLHMEFQRDVGGHTLVTPRRPDGVLAPGMWAVAPPHTLTNEQLYGLDMHLRFLRAAERNDCRMVTKTWLVLRRNGTVVRREHYENTSCHVPVFRTLPLEGVAHLPESALGKR